MATLPRPTIGLEPPQPIDIGRLLALKSMLGQQQGTQLENQQRALNLQDQQAMTSAMKSWNGKDPDALAQAVTDNGGSANARLGIEQHFLTLRKTYSDIAAQDAATGAKNLETIKGKYDLLQGSLDNVRGLPDEKIADGANNAISDALQRGLIDQPHAQSLTQSIQGKDPAGVRDAINMYEKDLQAHSVLVADAQKQSETEKNTQQAAEAKQSAAAKQAEAQFYQQHPEVGAPGVPAETISAADWLKKNPGKTFSDYTVAMKQVPAKTQYELAGGATGGLSPEAIDQQAENYYQTGKLPPVGRSAAGLALTHQIMQRATELHSGQSLAAGSAAYAANKASLESIQKNFDQVTAFENTAGKNLDTFLNTAKNIVDSGSPLINRPLRSVTKELAGSDKMAAFDAARTTALTEIAKVLNSSNASGVLSDSARGEVSQLIGPNATLKQIYSAANILKTDMANRHQSYQEQIADIQGRMGGKAGGGAAGTTRIKASDGSLHDIPTANLDAARKIDPKLQVVQ